MVEAPEPPHHHAHKTGLPWFDLVVPIAVLCISVASLLTSLQSEKSMHALVEQNRRLVSAQSTPLLMLDSANLVDGKQALSMTLSNVGTGPARIGWFRLLDDQGNSYSKNFYERVRQVDPTATFTSQQIGGTLMRSGEGRSVFNWPKPADGSPALASWAKLETDRFYLHGSACYCSMFNECRITDFGDDQPRAVDSCDKAGGAKQK
ncbi:hypothetical protein [Terriglobus sp.]|uniref:hypothetical protein n=1 Tax=Terriglobus sp. TaxID=1889013 RepID=UPI003B0087FC